MEYRRELQVILNSSTVTTAAVNFYEDDDYLDSIEEHPVPLFLTLCGSSTKPEESDSPDKKIRLSLEDDPSPDSLEHPKVQTVIDAEEVMRCRVVSKDQKLFVERQLVVGSILIFFLLQGVSVLSPQRLSERLSENALARQAVGESDVELAQYLKDERIALFLQNDEFISELRSNQEFMSALQRGEKGFLLFLVG